MSYSTGSARASGHLARSTDGRTTATVRWPIGEQHAVDRHGHALCGAPVTAVFHERPFEPNPNACLDCVTAAFQPG